MRPMLILNDLRLLSLFIIFNMCTSCSHITPFTKKGKGSGCIPCKKKQPTFLGAVGDFTLTEQFPISSITYPTENKYDEAEDGQGSKESETLFHKAEPCESDDRHHVGKRRTRRQDSDADFF